MVKDVDADLLDIRINRATYCLADRAEFCLDITLRLPDPANSYICNEGAVQGLGELQGMWLVRTGPYH
jgi:hypothetical protein